MFISTPSTSLALLLPLAASITVAAPTTRQAPNYPPHSQSQNFYLIANITDPASDFTPSINGWTLSSYHIGAGEAYAVLENPVPSASDPNSGPGRIFYVNGTAEEVRYNGGDLLSDGGTPPFPFGVSIDAQNVSNSAGEHAVYINAGTGQPGIGLAQFPNPIPYLTAPAQGGYIACNNTLLYGPAIQLLFKYQGEDTPVNCADVTFLPQCVVNGTVEEFGNTVNCYADVAGIDWSVYSA